MYGDTHFVYPFISSRTFELFPLFSYYEQCYYDHSWTSCCVDAFLFLCIYIAVQLLSYMVTVQHPYGNFEELANCFPESAPIYIPVRNVQRFQFVHTHANTCYHPSFIITVILVGVKCYLLTVLICISLRTNYAEHLFICLLTIYICIFFTDVSIKSSVPLNCAVFLLLCCIFIVSVHYTFWYKSLSWQMICKYFPHSGNFLTPF